MRRGQLLAYLGAAFAIGVFSGFNNFTLTLWLSGFTSSYLILGLMGNTRSFEGALVAPAVGFWSDRVWLGWLGRRRPFILVGGSVSALLLAFTPIITRLSRFGALHAIPVGTQHLVQAIATIFLFTLAFNAMGDIHDALLVDVTTHDERDRVSALRTVVSIGGQVAILVLGFFIWRNGVPDSAFVITALLMMAGLLATVLFVREPPPVAWAADRASIDGSEVRLTFWSAMRLYRGAAVFCLVAFFYWSGVNAILPLISIYVRNILHASTGESQLLPALLLLSTTIFALPMAKLADRFGKRRVIAAGYAVVAAIGLAGLVITTKEQGAIVLIIAGIGNAPGQVLAVPFLADLVPRRHIGAATGILAGSGSVAAPAASLIAGSLADVYGPRIIFLLMSIAVICALGLLFFVHAPGEDVVGTPGRGTASLAAG